MNKCATTLVIKGMQIKTTLTFHLTSVRMVIIENANNSKFWQGFGKKEPSYTAGENVNLYNHYGKQLGCFSKH
jgi:hypothetical protein